MFWWYVGSSERKYNFASAKLEGLTIKYLTSSRLQLLFTAFLPWIEIFTLPDYSSSPISALKLKLLIAHCTWNEKFSGEKCFCKINCRNLVRQCQLKVNKKIEETKENLNYLIRKYLPPKSVFKLNSRNLLNFSRQLSNKANNSQITVCLWCYTVKIFFHLIC